jgi:quinoprotein glucose dehydrogenase
MRADAERRCRPARVLALPLVLTSLLAVAGVSAQEPGTENGEWRYQSGDAGGTRFSPLDQIDASNFSDLEVAWVFRGDNFSPHANYTFK